MNDIEKVIKVLDTKLTYVLSQNNLVIELLAKTQLKPDSSKKVLDAVKENTKNLEDEVRQIIAS